ncbi:succinate dehydrogenase assembly factor 2 [Thalassobaculum fulvum]|jgi:antitoxin CptB|uniref:FAD assembly factor SdhE n=1 Tax=Thalassobaculum fulvum TaxID=1633335 RepID=A0A919CPL6_9PROT|nr:succinate dehydrogenase assembly factor 2 [Thalassobaculum fulvum]GHD47820.1 succinate dehydrogenase assembly factor 2 [Thalassobaculum fulvum]
MAAVLDARRKRLYYRSAYTGTKETDVFLGAFAERHLAELDDQQLDDYEKLLEIADPRLYKWITAQETPPAEYDTPVLRMIQAFDLTG